MEPALRYIQGYPEHIITPVTKMYQDGRLETWFNQRYPEHHTIKSEKALFNYTMAIKNRYMKRATKRNRKKAA